MATRNRLDELKMILERRRVNKKAAAEIVSLFGDVLVDGLYAEINTIREQKSSGVLKDSLAVRPS